MKRARRHLTSAAISKLQMTRLRGPAILSVELLESRIFLSGNVLATVVRGNLNVIGDNSANIIVLDQSGLNADQVRVVGAEGTTINSLSDPVVLSGVTHDANIRLSRGADSVTLSSLALPGNVLLNARGADSVILDGVHVAKQLLISNGARLGAITLTDVTVGKDLAVTGGQTITLRSVEVGRKTTITDAWGPNLLVVDDSTFHGAVHIETGREADVFRIDSGGDPLGEPTRFDGPVSILMGAGMDTLQVGAVGQVGNRSVFSRKVIFDGGSGQDTLINSDASTFASPPRIKRFESIISTPDVTAPTVSSTDPAVGAIGVALNKKIAATFSEAMDPSTITAANVILSGPGSVPVAGTVAFFGTTLTFQPTSPLAANTPYTATIGAGVKDLAGNPLAADFTWGFTSGVAADTIAPAVSSTDPADGATGVALNKKIAAIFSESMDPSTVTASNVTLTGPGGVAVAGSVAYVGNTVTFTPTGPLATNAVFTATITTGVKDLAGNALASNFVWSFRSGVTADTTAPVVASTDPANGEANVALNKKVAATFSESMDPLTFTTATFILTAAGGQPVTGAVAYVGTTATFTPAVPLAPLTTFTATITTGAKDLAGNPLASNATWTFTSGATPDITAPTVLSTNPADLQTNVFLNKTIAATFSESMDPVTVTATDFTVSGPGGVAVTGTVNYNAQSKIATFTPAGNFAPSTTFTATIAGGLNGAKDLAGNALAADKVWTFTTGTQIAQTPIDLGSAGAFAVMATSAISGSGATQINGDVGLNPGTSQGIPPAQVNGAIHIDDQAIINAQADLLAAYNDSLSRSTTSIALAGNMGGLTFTPGLYTNSSSVLIQGAGSANNVTLDAQGDPNAIFIFKMGSTLTTGPGAQVILAGGAKAANIFWQVGTSATLDTTTIFKGNILASVTITVNNGSAVEGRLLAGSNSAGSVTVNGSTITVPTA